MTRSRPVGWVAVIVVLGLAVAGTYGGIASAQQVSQQTNAGVEQGKPDLSVYLPQNEVGAGETTLDLRIGNRADVDVGSGSQEVVTARGVTVEITDGGPFDVRTGETPIGTVPDGQAVPASATIDVPADLEPGAYDIEVTTRYEYTFRSTPNEGATRRSATERDTVTVVVSDGPRFSISNLADTLSVGYDGEVTGTITNEGAETADDGILIVEPMSDSLHVEDTRYALPTLAPNESADFRYPVDVSGTANPGPKQLRFTVEYTDGPTTEASGDGETGGGGQLAGDERRSDSGSVTEYGPISERVVVDPRTDAFSIADDAGTVEAGGEREFTLEITNERPETLSNIDARLYDGSPLTATNDRAFVPELEPGESAEVLFAVRADADATAEVHPVELDFEYETERGDTVLSDTYQHPIEVIPGTDDGGGSAGTIVTVLAVFSIAGVGFTYWWRRR